MHRPPIAQTVLLEHIVASVVLRLQVFVLHVLQGPTAQLVELPVVIHARPAYKGIIVQA